MDISEGMQMAHKIDLPLSPLWLYRGMDGNFCCVAQMFPYGELSGSLVEFMYTVGFWGFGHAVPVCKRCESGSCNTVFEVTLVFFCCWFTIIIYTLFHNSGLSSWEKSLTMLCHWFLNSLHRFSATVLSAQLSELSQKGGKFFTRRSTTALLII